MPSIPVMRRLVAVFGLTLLLSACGGEQDPPKNTCGGARPSFALRINTTQGALPPDVSLQVDFGAGSETYDASVPSAPLEAVLCENHEVDGKLTEVECQLWTDGPAMVLLRASGYPDVSETLKSESDQCGLKTVEREFTLEREDAGGM